MLILGNGRMITRDAEHPYLECGAVAIDGTKIVVLFRKSGMHIRKQNIWM